MDKQNTHYGPRIGSYLGKPIFETIQDPNGTFIFDRIAHCVDNEFPLDQLASNERLFGAGLIYRQSA